MNLQAFWCLIKAGTIGWGKYLLGIDRTDPVLTHMRLNVCEGCHHIRHRNILGIKFRQCYVCTCVLEVKTKIKSTSCDLGKW